mmetsp:Transcript_5457/g.20500  ORF Transcript_5457/g.20500 Transcript_5457/m.20500 type:complete len:294 (-) Transcript_5457:138-1019(-)
MTKPAWLASRHRASASAASASSRTASASSRTSAVAASSGPKPSASSRETTTGNDSRLAASSAADHSRPSAGGTGAPGKSPLLTGGVFSTPKAALRNRRVVGATTPSDAAISYAKYSDCAASRLAQNLTTATVSAGSRVSSDSSAPSNTQKNTAPPELMSTAPPSSSPSARLSSASFSSATDSDLMTHLSVVQSNARSTLAGVQRRSLDLSLPANGDGPPVPLSVERKDDHCERNDAVRSSALTPGGVLGGDGAEPEFEATSPECEPSSDMRCGAASMNTVAISSTAPASCLHF